MEYLDTFTASFSVMLFSNDLHYHWVKDERFLKPVINSVNNILMADILYQTVVLLSAVENIVICMS